MGSSSLASYSTRALLLATGNNTRPSRDMARRCVTIRLDARAELPATRTFKRPNLLKEVYERREALVADALTIVAAWLNSGAAISPASKPLGNFTDWSRWCRDAVIWLGLPDPAASSFAAMEGDEDRQQLIAFFTAWHETFGSSPTQGRPADRRRAGRRG